MSIHGKLVIREFSLRRISCGIYMLERPLEKIIAHLTGKADVLDKKACKF